MNSVIKKERKSLISRVFYMIRGVSSKYDHDSSMLNFSFDDVRTNDDEVLVIASRRNELRNAVHSKSDAMVTINK